MKFHRSSRITLLILLAAFMVPLSCSDLTNVEEPSGTTPESEAVEAEITAKEDDSTATFKAEASMEHSDQPLYIVDGVRMSVSSGNIEKGENPLSELDPKTIESIEVLKDAAAASIYGAQAQNGVVKIRTKGNKKDGSDQEG
ncbi:MAG: TonB-dependent receptor plug domain-containing protein [Balneolaceae bacterium]|nr:TonB-dependent receptor plug domain-containing protein [Balneolaceae bacterium]